MSKLGILSVLSGILLCASCGSLTKVGTYGATGYSNDDIRLGSSKQVIIEKYGEPYTQEIESVDGKTVETIGYKERMYYGYSINTWFVFEDGKLVRKLQSEDSPDSSSVRLDPNSRVKIDND